MKQSILKISIISIFISYIILIVIIMIFDPFKIEWGNLGNGYEIDYSDYANDLHIIGKRGNIIAHGPVIIYKYNNKYITIKEKPRWKIDSIFKLSEKFNRAREREKAFNKIQYYDFWIIDKQLDSNYGPFQKIEFIKKFKELYLPDSLFIK